MSEKTAIVTGITGQDGWYLSGLLLERGYRVIGTSRDPAAGGPVRDGIVTARWDLRDGEVLEALLRDHRPTEFYNLAAFASGAGMYDDPVGIGEVNGLAVARMLEAVRRVDPAIRFCQASSSEMFGEPDRSPQGEDTAFHPRSPYGAAKLYAHEMVGIYDRVHGLFACSAILFNHESPRRGPGFVTGKIARAAARIGRGFESELSLGNLDAQRDWSFAGDSMRGMMLALQADAPGDYVFASGESHSVRDVCEVAFAQVGLDYRDHVRTSDADYRPAEAVPLVGDASKAQRVLGWAPQMDFPTLIRSMVDAELDILQHPANNPR
ncbi:GDP-mannose 4,6-dehydratase [Tsuneonella amylolytica]|uniref:GDP-mannose 4,6-dehydratase n=1 Tax=Tsuneonella amylolytica TaxID=2338327 RepID=UPI000EAA79D1|nr:GDP-mannose 4,6-dehydratase [Tsuneonella amylolytica]